ncbi:unnamed protein product [Urochloa humidicola]
MGRVGERAEEGRDGGTLVAACERVRRVDVGVAGGAERGGVGAAGHGGGGVLADLAEPHASVAGTRAVRAGVAPGAQERAVGAAVQARRLRRARVAGARHPPPASAPAQIPAPPRRPWSLLLPLRALLSSPPGGASRARC